MPISLGTGKGFLRLERGIAQLEEQRIPNPQVVGSNPTAPATYIHRGESIVSKFGTYLKDCRKELKKVHWPDKPKVVETSIVVTACTAVFAFYLWLVDQGIARLFQVLFY